MATKTKPLVLVCGWLNAPRRGVVKYVEMYKSFQYQTMMLESNASFFVLSPSSIHKDAVAQVQKLRRASDELVIIPHMISNGGCISWYCLEDHLAKAGISYRVPAMIFDSAPNSDKGMLGVVSNASEGLDSFTKDIQSPLKRSIAKVVLAFGYSAAVLRWRLLGTPDPKQRNFDRFIIRDARIPKLFLYSDEDKMVVADEIEVGIAKARSLGTPVETVKFHGSEHVAHFRLNPELYSKTIRQFLTQHKLEP